MQPSISAGPFASIHQLPNEILLLIYELFVSGTDELEYRGKTLLAPRLGTCRHWRDVSLSTPSLWTHIELSPVGFALGIDREKAKLHRTDLVKLYLERSRESALHIKVHRSSPREAFMLLCSHSSRWISAEIPLAFISMRKFRCRL